MTHVSTRKGIVVNSCIVVQTSRAGKLKTPCLLFVKLGVSYTCSCVKLVPRYHQS